MSDQQVAELQDRKVTRVVAPESDRREASLYLVVLGILAVSFNLRIGLASIPPVLTIIRHDLGLTRSEAGLLTTIPVACMGIFAPAAVRLGQRVGTERTILGAMGLLGVATIARGIGSNVVTLYAATLAIGLAMAVTGTLLSGFIKGRAPDRAAAVMGMNTASLGFGAACAASGTVPLSRLLNGSWSAALSAWGIPALMACALWFRWIGSASSHAAERHVPRPPLPWRSARAWLLTAIFSAQSFVYYAELTWLAPAYQERGWSAGMSGLLLSTFSILQIGGSLMIPMVANRWTDRRPWLAGAAAMAGIGCASVAVVPLTAPWLWAAVLGFAAGAMFPLSLTLPLDDATTSTEAASSTAMVLAVGYVLAAVAPFTIGALRDGSGSFRLPFLTIAALAFFLVVLAAFARPGKRLTGEMVRSEAQ